MAKNLGNADVLIEQLGITGESERMLCRISNATLRYEHFGIWLFDLTTFVEIKSVQVEFVLNHIYAFVPGLDCIVIISLM